MSSKSSTRRTLFEILVVCPIPLFINLQEFWIFTGLSDCYKTKQKQPSHIKQVIPPSVHLVTPSHHPAARDWRVGAYIQKISPKYLQETEGVWQWQQHSCIKYWCTNKLCQIRIIQWLFHSKHRWLAKALPGACHELSFRPLTKAAFGYLIK